MRVFDRKDCYTIERDMLRWLNKSSLLQLLTRIILTLRVTEKL